MKVRLMLTVTALALVFAGTANAQIQRTKANAIALRATVRPIVNIRPAVHTIVDEGTIIEITSLGNDRIDVLVRARGERAARTEVSIPLQVNSNVKSYLFRASGLQAPIAGDISLQSDQNSSGGRTLALENDRVFGQATRTGMPGDTETKMIRLSFDSSSTQSFHFQINAVPQGSFASPVI